VRWISSGSLQVGVRRSGELNPNIVIITKNGSEITTVNEWFEAAPPKGGRDQWVPGRSAFECARAWCEGESRPCVPSELIALLASRAETANVKISRAMPEHRVRFDQIPGEPRNADLVAVGSDSNGVVAISIEAKADEPFDRYTRDVLLSAVKKIADEEPTNSVERIQNLAQTILPKLVQGAKSLGDLRYQLLTGLAGAVAFANVLGADRAAFIVHEFVTDKTVDEKHQLNARDLNDLIFRISQGAATSLRAGELLGPFRIPSAPLFKRVPLLFVGKAVRNLRTM
jgi:Domain of unknown function (DUF6946)